MMRLRWSPETCMVSERPATSDSVEHKAHDDSEPGSQLPGPAVPAVPTTREAPSRASDSTEPWRGGPRGSDSRQSVVNITRGLWSLWVNHNDQTSQCSLLPTHGHFQGTGWLRQVSSLRVNIHRCPFCHHPVALPKFRSMR